MFIKPLDFKAIDQRDGMVYIDDVYTPLALGLIQTL